VEGGLDQFGCLVAVSWTFLSSITDGASRASLGQETMQIVVECNTDTILLDCIGQDLIVGRRAQTGIAYVNDIETMRAQQGR